MTIVARVVDQLEEAGRFVNHADVARDSPLPVYKLQNLMFKALTLAGSFMVFEIET